jgi:hypothetical protein
MRRREENVALRRMRDEGGKGAVAGNCKGTVESTVEKKIKTRTSRRLRTASVREEWRSLRSGGCSNRIADEGDDGLACSFGASVWREGEPG